MCTADSFNLTKIICNRKNVLMSIPDIRRCLCFKVNLNERPRNRGGMLSMLSSFYNPLGLVSTFIYKERLIVQELCQEGLHWDKQVSE